MRPACIDMSDGSGRARAQNMFFLDLQSILQMIILLFLKSITIQIGMWRDSIILHGILMNGIVCAYDGTANNKNQHIYINSIEQAYYSSGTNQIGNTGHDFFDFCLGLEGIGDNHDFDGIIDEVRIFDTNITADWIKTEYNNQYDPNSFYSIGSSNRVKIPSFTDFKYLKILLLITLRLLDQVVILTSPS